jgi:hypothetical protein
VPGLLDALKDDSAAIRNAAKEGLSRLEEYLAAEDHWQKRLGK